MAATPKKTPDQPSPQGRQGGHATGDGDPSLDRFLLIPYFAADAGLRPLPPNVVAWFCESVLIDGAPHTGAPLVAGSTVMISVRVRNRGILPASTTFRFFWLDPTTAFTPAALANGLIGQAWLSVPGSSGPIVSELESPAVPWTIKTTLPPHICLLVEVGCTGDSAPGTYNATADRHYAQHNVNIVAVAPAEKTFFLFYANNPLRETTQYELRVRPVEREALAFLEQHYRARAVAIKGEALALYRVEAGSDKAGRKIHTALKPNEKQLFGLMIEPQAELRPHEFMALEIEQAGPAQGREGRENTGSIGVLLFAESAPVPAEDQ